ncbi:hypothetical protein ACUIAK_09790 [Bacillus cytotoxicus]
MQTYRDEQESRVLQQKIELLQKERERLLQRLSVYEEEYRTPLDYIDRKEV